MGNRRKFRLYILYALVASVALIWYATFSINTEGELVVRFFDVGQGDATLIEVPGGAQMLIDGGPSTRVLEKLGEVLPYWDRSIDIVLLTHPHADHVSGLLGILERYRVGVVVESGVKHDTPEYHAWRRTINEQNVKVVNARAGMRIELSDDIIFEILTPLDSKKNDAQESVHGAMVVGKLMHGDTSMLFTGDAERALERELLFRSYQSLDVDILKVGHHGSNTSSSEEFLRAVTPNIAVVQVGAKNRYRHPHREILERFERLGISVIRNDESGDITIIDDGARYRVETAR